MSDHFMQSHIGRVHACLAITCHLHFRQNDRDLVRAAAVTVITMINVFIFSLAIKKEEEKDRKNVETLARV